MLLPPRVIRQKIKHALVVEAPYLVAFFNFNLLLLLLLLSQSIFLKKSFWVGSIDYPS